MKYTFLALPLLLAACAPEPEVTIVQPISDTERLVAAVEAEDCKLDPSNSERVLGELGLTPEQLSQIGVELVQSGRAEVTPTEFRLTSGACAA